MRSTNDEPGTRGRSPRSPEEILRRRVVTRTHAALAALALLAIGLALLLLYRQRWDVVCQSSLLSCSVLRCTFATNADALSERLCFAGGHIVVFSDRAISSDCVERKWFNDGGRVPERVEQLGDCVPPSPGLLAPDRFRQIPTR